MSYQPTWDGRSGYGGKKRSRHPVRNTILAVLVLLVALLVTLEAVIGLGAKTNIVGEPEVMVIFGCKVETWGPSTTLKDRLDTAYDYLKDHPGMTVVVTGGKGDDEHKSEAQAMRDYLTEKGFRGTILMEDQALNTWENVKYTRKLLEKQGIQAKSFLLVSSDFHLARIQMLWGRGWKGESHTISTLAAPVTHQGTRIESLYREPAAFLKCFLFDR